MIPSVLPGSKASDPNSEFDRAKSQLDKDAGVREHFLSVLLKG